MGADDDKKMPLSSEQEAIFNKHLSMARTVARKMAAKLGMSAEDLESVGQEALWKLAFEWQPGVPWSFTATAHMRLERAMFDEYRARHPEAERERVARRRREARGEPEPEVTAQPTAPPEVAAVLQKAVVTFDPATDDVFPLELRDMTTSLTSKVGRKRTVELILEAAAEYPEEEQQLIVACLYEEISARELARRIDQPHATVERKLNRVKKKLRRVCEQRNITW